ncbi:MAG TPA: chain length determinant protein EpsF [Methylophilus sp.]|uniref:chain length determinant protein EpsF n=1 Tax=Methylophilus sp. TaxID=29541 RepID=UPI002BA78D4D|nr:chain length determinant protein EpsF [Methylophilus sp.]HSH88027.1 chain length determinant protein EpsF [Methylophilus sp.]
MNFSQFFIILTARKKIIFIVAILTMLTAVIVSMLWPKNYLATTKVLLNYKGVDPVTGTTIPAQLMPGFLGTQADIIQSKSVGIDVVKKLKLSEIPSIREDFEKSIKNNSVDIDQWLAERLLNNLSVTPSRESSVILIGYKGIEPSFAATMANAFADSYITLTLKLKMDPALKASQYLSEQTKVLRENLQKSQEKLSQYQQDHGLTSIQEAYDVEGSKLRDLSSQYGMMQSQSIDANSRRNDAAKNTSDSPDVAQNPVIQNLRMSLVSAESKLAELGQRYSKNHPQYISTDAEVSKLRSQLQTEIDRTVVSLSNSASINSQRLGDVRSQLEKQKQKVLELNRSRSELMILEKDIEIAQNALASVNNRFSQTALEGQSNQADISILEAATPPTSPSNPRLILIAPFSLIIGIMLGCFFALIAEFIDRRVRSKDDIVGLAEIPVYEYSVIKA